ncbi:hypothetical protein Barb6_01693 [Bacteroidales bacterium Barb6]|nr:hypothetical protein Barb6_01693 [Bacteroidales bacterium Barb6]
MDAETLTNHISRLGKHYFENACKIVLTDVFNLRVINVDGKGDGGTDFIAIDDNAQRTLAAYQITTQKTDIANKAYKDAKKAIDRLGVNRYFFLASYILNEIDARKIENQISSDLSIQSTCLSANSIAGLLLSENLLNKFLEETNYPLPEDYTFNKIDYREQALHSYTLLSNDAKDMKDGIYDDTVLLIVSENGGIQDCEILEKVKSLLGLNEVKDDVLKRRIGALFGKEKIKRDFNGNIILSDKSKNDIEQRKKIYEIELSSMVSAQTDLLYNEYNTEWDVDDSKKITVWIAEAFINEQIAGLKEIKASIVSHPIFNIDGNSISKIKEFFLKEKSIDKDKIDKLIEDLLMLASNHPLISKISRASIYLALEGGTPISRAKSLGANRWSDFKLIVEPTVAIPYICSHLYQGCINKYFDMSIQAVNRAKKLGIKSYIPHFYINECAGHLLQARKYDVIGLDENELQYSGNAFVANYYGLKLNGARVPNSFMDYLCTFSSAIKVERVDVKGWIRSLMTDIQSILFKERIEFVAVPHYNREDCNIFEKEYLFKMEELKLEKPSHLINHDIWALQFTNDKILKEGEHWITLTYDRSLISFASTDKYNGWVANPVKFLDLTETNKPLSETQFVSLLHSVATFSEKTLSVGARIMDKIISYASKEIQNWEFKRDFENFKKETINSIDVNSYTTNNEIDRKIEVFLKSKGIVLKMEEDVEII